MGVCVRILVCSFMQVKSLCHILIFKRIQSSKGTSYQPGSDLVVIKV